MSQLHISARLFERVYRGGSLISRGDTTQHMDTPLSRAEEAQPGSHVISPRRGYEHHGIYVGNGKVIHYAGLARGNFRGRIEEVELAAFAYGRSVWTRRSGPPTFSPQEIVRRARSRVGENRYRVFRNNCEHFCEWCLRGDARSYQVERFFRCRAAVITVLRDCVARLTAGTNARLSAMKTDAP